jgi:hypothetical protein
LLPRRDKIRSESWKANPWAGSQLTTRGRLCGVD